MDEIRCGGFVWKRDPSAEDNRIDDAHIFVANSIACDELSVDTLDAEIYSECLFPLLLETVDGAYFATADGKLFGLGHNRTDLRAIPYGTPVEYYRGDALFAKLYKSALTRTGRATFALSAVSAIGLLDKLYHYGGIYTGRPASEVFADIIGNSVSYMVAPEVADVAIYGWLPYDTKRNNLHQLLFSLGSSIKKAANGTLQFTFLDVSEPAAIGVDDVFDGGDIAYGTSATGVDVTEHAYIALPTDKETTLFDNTDGGSAAASSLITFSVPIHDLTPSGNLIINSSGVNYAIVSGTGVLTGKEYTHQTTVLSVRNEDAAGDEHIVSVADCTLINSANVQNVADRALAYYGAAEEVSADLEASTHRPGDSVILTDPFGDRAQGLIKSMDVTMSRLLRASATIITNYTPAGYGNYYNHVAILTADTTWTVPADARGRIMAVLIQGGQGGQSGLPGDSAPNDNKHGSNTFTDSFKYTTYYQWYEFGTGGAGGAAGTGGQAGKVLRTTIDVVAGQTFAATIGAGGVGGVYDGLTHIAGLPGGETAFGGYSSAEGVAPGAGFQDQFSGRVYAVAGNSGINGGSGSGYDPDKEQPADPLAGPILEGSVVVGPTGDLWRPGESPNQKTIAYDTSPYSAKYYSGRGGGAAAGQSGSAGQNAGSYSRHLSGSTYYLSVIAPSGGNGADAAIPAASQNVPGSGGHGGHGGGGAGGNGSCTAQIRASSGYSTNISVGLNPASGGAGTNGGDGAPGCVIIYY